MSIGDINSAAAGSGARYNDGKPNLALIPAWIVAEVALALRGTDVIPQAPSQRAWLSLSALGRWQGLQDNGGASEFLRDALYVLKDPLRSAARVFEYGSRKYKAWNWIKGMPWSVPLACAQRHALAMMEGEELDPESGLPHEGHLACNIIMLMQFDESFIDGNDITWEVVMPKAERPLDEHARLGAAEVPASEPNWEALR